MRTRTRWFLLTAVLVVGLVWPVLSAPSAISASGGVWFYIPPIGPVAPHWSEGLDVHMSFNVQGLSQFGLGVDRGNVHMNIVDRASGRLTAVLTAKQVWDVKVEGDGIRFWTQFKLKMGWVPDNLLYTWTWWVSESGGGQVMMHSLGPWNITKGNIKIRGL
jgi:hypothetical protein